MDARKLVLPAVALVGGAMLGRLVGFKGLVRVGMAAFTLANMTESAGLISAGRRVIAPARRQGREAGPAQAIGPTQGRGTEGSLQERIGSGQHADALKSQDNRISPRRLMRQGDTLFIFRNQARLRAWPYAWR
jgi:hypothetical protein